MYYKLNIFLKYEILFILFDCTKLIIQQLNDGSLFMENQNDWQWNKIATFINKQQRFDQIT